MNILYSGKKSGTGSSPMQNLCRGGDPLRSRGAARSEKPGFAPRSTWSELEDQCYDPQQNHPDAEGLSRESNSANQKGSGPQERLNVALHRLSFLLFPVIPYLTSIILRT